MDSLDNDPEAILEALGTLIAPGEVFEIRALHASKWRGMIGYFNEPEIAARAVANLSEDYAGIYVTLNPLLPDLLYRVNNTFTKFVEGLGSKDHEVTGRNWLPLDFDPVRPTGISSTHKQQREALELASTVADTLELTYGISGAVIGSSGNGAHLLYPISMPNTQDVRDTVKEFIRTVSMVYSTGSVSVDHTVFNASRIWRLYGTVARKGSNAPERPHRLSKILYAPPERVPVPFKLIREVARASVAKVETATARKPSTYPPDEARWRDLNRQAMKRLEDWVPEAFGEDARPYLNGYRISSDALGRDREEDLSIQPMPIGIVDFGEHDSDEETLSGHRTPVGVLAEHIHGGDKPEAAKWLSSALDVKESEFEGIAERYASTDEETDEDESDDYLEEEVKDDANHIKGFDTRAIRSGGEVARKKYEAKQFLVNRLLPRGAWLLISRPKMGKSWITLQIGMACASGGHFLGEKVEQGEVLMLLFEEQDARLNGRLKALNGGVMPNADVLDKMHFVTLDALVDNPFPKGEQGCVVLRRILKNNPLIKFITIDTFSLFRDHDADYGGGVYDKDYAAVMPIIRLASEMDVTVVCVHHERKGATVIGKSDVDFMESASGSAGLSAAFEGVMRIEGHRTEEAEEDDVEEDGVEKAETDALTRKLKISGRDVEKDVIVRNISFDLKQGGWYRTGKLNVENAIVQAIRSSLSLTQTELIAMLPSIAKNEIKRKLIELVADNILVKTNYNYTLEYAGDAHEVPPELIASAINATDLVLKMVEWRGAAPISFLYEAIKGFSPATIRTSLTNLTASGCIKREDRGIYKITKKGSLRLLEQRNAAKEDDDISSVDDLL